MANLFSVTVPLVIRHPNAIEHIMVERFPHPDGVLYFLPFWHERPYTDSILLAKGEISGEGPWKVGAAVVTVLACRGSNAALAVEFSEWQSYLTAYADQYVSREEMVSIAKQHGAILDSIFQ